MGSSRSTAVSRVGRSGDRFAVAFETEEMPPVGEVKCMIGVAVAAGEGGERLVTFFEKF